MKRSSKSESSAESVDSRCPLVQSVEKRAAANRRTANIQDHFPPGLAQPALRALANGGFTHLRQLSRVREADLRELHGMGPKALAILRQALVAEGLDFAPSTQKR